MNLLRRLSFSFRYFGRPPWDTGISPPELLAFLQGRGPGRAIDLGCTANVITLALNGWQLLGVVRPNAIRVARRKIRHAACERKFGRRCDELISGPFDFALDLGCFHGLSSFEQIAYLDRLTAILASGGHWMVYARLRPSPHAGSYGLQPADIERIEARFRLLSRQDGFNRSPERPAVYLLLQKP
jgi:hypothetical protein